MGPPAPLFQAGPLERSEKHGFNLTGWVHIALRSCKIFSEIYYSNRKTEVISNPKECLENNSLSSSSSSSTYQFLKKASIYPTLSIHRLCQLL